MRDDIDGEPIAPEIAALFASYDRALGVDAKREAVEILFNAFRVNPGVYQDN